MNKPVPHNSSNWPVAARFWGWLKRAGPFIATQSRQISERWAEHHGRLATVDALKEVFVEERKAAIRVKEKLLERATNATDEVERMQLLAGLDAADRHLRSVTIQDRALDHLTERAQTTAIPEREPDEHWFDRFLQLSRTHNEPWRQDLLAKALALEISVPGSISERALWTIGTMQEHCFHAFAHYLDAAINIEGDRVLPLSCLPISEPVPDCAVKGITKLGPLLVILEQEGLVMVQGFVKEFQAETDVIFEHGDARCAVHFTSDHQIPAVLCTAVGAMLANLYTPKATAYGSRCFEQVIQTLSREHSVTPK